MSPDEGAPQLDSDGGGGRDTLIVSAGFSVIGASLASLEISASEPRRPDAPLEPLRPHPFIKAFRCRTSPGPPRSTRFEQKTS